MGSGGGLSAQCEHLRVGCQLRGAEQGQEAQGGARWLRKIREHLGGDDLSWGRSASRRHQFPVGQGPSREKVSLVPMRLLRGPAEPEPLGPGGVRPGAHVGDRPLLASSRYMCLLMHKEHHDLVRVLCWLNF